MAKRTPLFGVNNYVKKRRRKRPGRHSKSPNKGARTKKRSVGQGKPI